MSRTTRTPRTSLTNLKNRMWSSLRKKKGNILWVLLVLFSCEKKAIVDTPDVIAPPYIEVDTFDILSEKKLELTVQYNEENYGFSSYKLDTPRIVVVHYTA